MKEQNEKLSRGEFISFVKAILRKKSLEENKPLYFEYRVSGNSSQEKTDFKLKIIFIVSESTFCG